MTDSTTTSDSVLPAEPTAMSRFFALPARTVRRIFKKGPISSAKWVWFLIGERICEWRMGIDCGGTFEWDEDSGVDPDCHGSGASSYRVLKTITRAANIRPGEDVLLDYGCGKGRSVIVMGCSPLKKVIGVEMSDQLCEMARENVHRAQSKLRTPDVEILQADATQYEVPAEVTMVYIFNSFGGKVLAAALEKVRESLEADPRKLKIYYCFPDSVPDGLANCDWLTCSAELSTSVMEWLTLRVYETKA